MSKLIINCANGEIEEIPLTQEELDKINSPRPIEDCLNDIREMRNILLIKSDKYMLEDYPLAPEKKLEWKAYRQELRDLPDNCDPHNPIFPTKPL